MIDNLDALFADSGHPGLAELRQVLHDVLAPFDGRLQRCTKLTRRGDRFTYRFHFTGRGAARSLIVKRLAPDIALRNQLVVARWLPAVGLHHLGPPLLAVAAARGGECVWHVLEDLGECTLLRVGRPDCVRAAVEACADMHARFAAHPLLAECRNAGAAFGNAFYGDSVRDAIRALQALRPALAELCPERRALRERLLARLHRLLDQEAARARALDEIGGPETLLHGDLDRANVLVPGREDPTVRLIDWDHVGVGPASYDLSTFLSRFPGPQRRFILGLYEQVLARYDFRLPPVADLNQLFDTAQCARLANSVIWPALAVPDGHADWAFAELAAIDGWFDTVGPVLE